MESAGEINPTWSMPANSGWARITCTAPARSWKGGIVVCSFTVEGDFWQRDRELSAAKLARDFHVSLPQVVVELSALEALHDSLVEWQSSLGSFESQLGVTFGDQRLCLSIARDAGLIYSAEKPACTVSYESGPTMKGKWSFIVDQSCIRVCAEGLREFIGRVAPS